MKYIFITILTITFYSCGSNSPATSNKAAESIKTFMSHSQTSGQDNTEILEIEFIDDITPEDSINLHFQQYTTETINSVYDGFLKKEASIKTLLYKSEKHLSDQPNNTYYQEEVTDYKTQLENLFEERNKFIDASEGKATNSKWEHLFHPIGKLKKKKSDEILGKVYKATVSYFATNVNGTDAKKTETSFFILTPDESKVIKAASSYDPKPPTTGLYLFEKKEINKSEPESENNDETGTTTVETKYISAEFTGVCTVVFKTNEGKELKFYNPNLGDYKNDEGCGIDWSIKEATFRITYKKGKITYYSEDVGDVETDGNVLLKIEQR